MDVLLKKSKIGDPLPYPTSNRQTSHPWIGFHPLAIREEDERFIVGRKETGDFIALPKVGGRTLELLLQGNSFQETQSILETEYGVKVDLKGFIDNMIRFGFVQTFDGQPIESKVPPRSNLGWLKPKRVRWLFQWPAMLFYSLLLLSAGLSLITHPQFLPNYRDFIWTSSTTIVFVGNTAWMLINLVMHELAHMIAARSLGIRTRISLGTRLHYLVSHVDVTGLWALPRNKRYRVYMAGIMWDLTPISIAILLLTFAPLSDLTRNILSAIILSNYLKIVWQFRFYLRTDIFFVFQDLMHCHNLHRDAFLYLQSFFARLAGVFSRRKRDDSLLRLIHPEERRKVALYAWIMFFGTSLGLLVFISYGIPIVVKILSLAAHSIMQGIRTNQPQMIIDGALTWMITGTMQILFVVVLTRGLLKRIRSKIQRSSGEGFHETSGPSNQPISMPLET